MDKISLLNSIDKLKQSKILVIGDFAIDEMIYGDTERISREAPVLILLHSHTNIILGAASNAAHNISTVNGGRVLALGVYGNDYHAPILLKTMEEAGISTKYMIQDSSRPTTVKTRISGKCSQSVTQQVVRIDRQSTLPLSAEIEKKVLDNMENAIKETARRRKIQMEYNEKNNIVPKTIKKMSKCNQKYYWICHNKHFH